MLLPILRLLFILPCAVASTDHAVSRWKAPHAKTPADLAARWRAEDEALHAYISKSVPAVLEHTGSEAFDAHLRGVQAILRYWGSPEYLYNAGLFHSIYGTEGFQGFSLPLSERDAIRGLIGDKSEKLCWIFCMVDRGTVDETVFNWKVSDASIPDDSSEQQYTFLARPELGRFPIRLNKSEWVDFLELTLADWLEQVQGAAETSSEIFHWKVGEAYAYRRTAYAKMVDILVHERRERLEGIVREMHADVYGTEGAFTRGLVQPRTPPMSDAAKQALAALRSAGEDVRLSFAPVEANDAQRDLSCSEAGIDEKLDDDANVYETDDLLSMYLGLHFPLSGSIENVSPIIDHANSPIHGLRFPQRVADLLLSLKPARTNNHALDVGCAVGGTSFELAKSFDHVEAFDFSASFIAAAKRIQSGEQLKFRVPVEGDISEDVAVVLEPGVDAGVMERVKFFQGDACALSEYADSREGFGSFDGVIMANLLCRLPDPTRTINALPKIVNAGGVVVVVTPFTWLEDFTPKTRWLGGFHDEESQSPIFSKDRLKEAMESVGFEKIHEEQMPLVIREHRRKYQYIVSEATAWRKK